MSLATLVRHPAAAPVAPATSATPVAPTAPAAPRSTTATVRLYNASGVSLRVAAHRDAGLRDVLPPVGTTITPGGTLRLDVARPVVACPVDGFSGGPRTVVVAFEAVLADGAVAGRRYLLAMTADVSGRAGHCALTVPDFLTHRTAGDYVVVEDGRRVGH